MSTRIWISVAALLFSLIATGCANNVDGASQTQTHTVTASAGVGGSVTPTSVSVVAGASTALAVIPNTGYSIASVTPTGCAGTLMGNTYTTGPITADCAVAASFVANVATNTFTVTASAGAGGSITPASVSVIEGASTVLAVIPNTGYSIASITPTGCTGTLTAGSTYTTGPITANCTVTASFSLNSYTVTATAGAGGGISPGNATVAYGTKTTFTVIPSAGYTASATGCGGALMGNTYTTGAITANCAVMASFTLNSYTVTATSIAAGGITPASATVAYGAKTNFTVIPNPGFSIAGVTASGCSGILLGFTYTTDPITANCSVTARFAIGVATSLTAGYGHTCVLISAGTVRCWGRNLYGELGNGTSTDSTTPVTVIGLSDTVTALAAGDSHTCALTSAGAVQCWGRNNYGQLGSGGTTDFTTAVTVSGLSGPVTALAAGYGHTCALTSSGEVQCWGWNVTGQLGNSSTTDSTRPVTVVGLSGAATAVVAGTTHTCAVISPGAVQCWGSNSNGELGNGSTTPNMSITPVTVTGLHGLATALQAGYLHTCALSSTGAVECWV